MGVERMFYTGQVDQFPDVPCPHCQSVAQLYTVPLRLVPAGETSWQALCADCFRTLLQVEPTDDLTMKPIKHSRRGRRSYG